MKVRRKCKLLVEPPSSATGDIAFNLIVFFLVWVLIFVLFFLMIDELFVVVFLL